MVEEEGEGVFIIEEEGEVQEVMEKEDEGVNIIEDEGEDDEVMEEEGEGVEEQEQGKLRTKLFTWRSIG